MVFAGLYPVDADEYETLRDALEKLHLNDSSFSYEPENSAALGCGFRCGFLGLLHMEIVQERLEREFSLNLVVTAPSVRYRVTTRRGEVVLVDSPAKLILTGDEYLGGVQNISSLPPPGDIARIEDLKLAEEKRGVQKGFEYVSPRRALLTCELPLNEIVRDFYERLK